MIKDRKYFKTKILERLEEEKENIILQFNQHKIHSFFVDDLLPEEDAKEIYKAFPLGKEMTLKKNMREFKFIDAQLNKHKQILEEITYAFQDNDILDFMSKITGISKFVPDSSLYAGGLSRMEKGQYLNPHLDNSHNGGRNLYRVLNLLFYVTPDREQKDGGNLELWDHGPKEKQRVISSKFNRLVIMVTNKDSWHSVSPVVQRNRCCISNYYFSKTPLTDEEYFHVTSFKGFPDQKFRNILLSTDNLLRMFIRKIFKKGAYKITHQYQKD